MITACKSYITDHHSSTIWEQEQQQLISKCNDCLRLNDEYQKCFQKTKKKIEENPDEKQFEFSETYIFGKINTFARRLVKVIEMFTMLSNFNRLALSKIEGIDMLYAKFQLITTTMKKKPYDLLDYRKMDFDSDFEEFKRQIYDLEVRFLLDLVSITHQLVPYSLCLDQLCVDWRTRVWWHTAVSQLLRVSA